ncbi:MAG: hypothetical protein AAF725_09840 [Acidobacteriota bacterium]
MEERTQPETEAADSDRLEGVDELSDETLEDVSGGWAGDSGGEDG